MNTCTKTPTRTKRLEQSHHRTDTFFFGAHGRVRKIPHPLLRWHNTIYPEIVVTDTIANGQPTACLRWFAEVAGDEEKTALLKGFQYLFPIIIDPYDQRLFGESNEQDIEMAQVVSVDAENYSSVSPRNSVHFVCYEMDPLTLIQARIVLLAEPWFGLVQPAWYADLARGDSKIRRVLVHGK